MAWTQSQLDALDAAIASGVRQVDFGDKRVMYGSLVEMMQARAAIAAALAGPTATDGRCTIGSTARV